jgi:hypothetical protein
MNTYKLNFLERAWLVRCELVLGNFSLPCLFLLDSKVISDELFTCIISTLKEKIYNWQELEDIKKTLAEKVHPEFSELELLQVDLENSVIADITPINYIQWFFLKNTLPYINLYEYPTLS